MHQELVLRAFKLIKMNKKNVRRGNDNNIAVIFEMIRSIFRMKYTFINNLLFFGTCA